MKNSILELFKAYERETEWDGNAIPESMCKALANDIVKLFQNYKPKRVGIIGGGFQGFICGIDEAASIVGYHIARENLISGPRLPNQDEWPEREGTAFEDQLKKLDSEAFRREYLFDFNNEQIVNKFEALNKEAKEAALAFESLGEKMIDHSYQENKKHKGHERPYKYHR